MRILGQFVQALLVASRLFHLGLCRAVKAQLAVTSPFGVNPCLLSRLRISLTAAARAQAFGY
jgi:hypothetical protein